MQQQKNINRPQSRITLTAAWPGLRYLSLGVVLAYQYLLINYGSWRSAIDVNGMNVSFGSAWFFGTSLAVFLCAAFFRHPFGHLLDLRATPWALGAGNALGVTLLLLAGPLMRPAVLPEAFSHLMFPLGYMFCGLCSAVCMLYCARVYCQAEHDKLFYYAVLSEVMVFAIFCIVATYAQPSFVAGGPSLAGSIALYVLLPAALLCIFTTGPTPRTASSATAIANETNRDAVSRHGGEETGGRIARSWRLFLVIFIFSLTASIVRNCYAGPQDTFTFQADARVTMLFRIALACALLVISFAARKRIPLEKFYLALFSGIALALVSIPLFGVDNSILRASANSLFFILDLVVWCLLAFIAKAKRYSPLLTFGLGRSCVCAGMLVGYLLGITTDVANLLLTNRIAVALMIVAMLACATFVFSERSFADLLSEIDVRELNFHLLTSKPEVTQRDGDARPRPWVEACQHIGERAQLSPREQEVFVDLANNRTAHSIASHLCISLNTVRTHTRNIFAKLDVHSRDELIDLVQNEFDAQHK